MRRRPVTVERIADVSPSYPIRSLRLLRRPVRRFRVRDHPSLFPFLRRQLLETVRSSPYLHRVHSASRDGAGGDSGGPGRGSSGVIGCHG